MVGVELPLGWDTGTSSVPVCCRLRILGLLASHWEIHPSQDSIGCCIATPVTKTALTNEPVALGLEVSQNTSVQDRHIQRNRAVGQAAGHYLLLKQEGD